MGFILAHLHAGEEVLKVGSYRTKDRRLYNFGAMGPDFIFMESAEWEKRLHDEKAVELASFLLENADEETMDFAMGYATHIYTDVEMYPVSMHLAENNFNEYLKIEVTFDVLLAKSVYKTDISDIRLASKIYVGKTLKESVCDLLERGIKEVYGIGAPKKNRINRAYKKFIRYARFLDFMKSRQFKLTKNLLLKGVGALFRRDFTTFFYPLSVERKYEELYPKVYESLERGIELSKLHLEKYLL